MKPPNATSALKAASAVFMSLSSTLAQPEIEANHQKQHRNRGVEVDQDRNSARQRRHAERDLVDVPHHHPGVREQRLEVAGSDVVEIFQQHRTGRDLAPFQALEFAPRADLGLWSHRREQHHVVEYLDFDFAPAQAEPFGDLQVLFMMPAAVESDLAESQSLAFTATRSTARLS